MKTYQKHDTGTPRHRHSSTQALRDLTKIKMYQKHDFIRQPVNRYGIIKLINRHACIENHPWGTTSRHSGHHATYDENEKPTKSTTSFVCWCAPRQSPASDPTTPFAANCRANCRQTDTCSPWVHAVGCTPCRNRDVPIRVKKNKKSQSHNFKMNLDHWPLEKYKTIPI